MSIRLAINIGRVKSKMLYMGTRLHFHRVAIIGTGPSGFYSAKYLLEQNSEICVDMFEKLPTPFGLVRSGVAPDHPEVKTVSTTFCEVAESPRFRYFGNVTVGHEETCSSLSITSISKAYSGVILAYGATSDNDLNITGEHTLDGIHSARHFVNWYNGHPDIPRSDDSLFDLSKVEHVVVVGQGNVALDCARILTRDPDELASTDISHSALAVLKKSNVRTVSVVGRRGHVQSAFTIKEFRELTKLTGVTVNVREDDVTAGLTAATVKELDNNRPKKRIVELIQSVAKQQLSAQSTSKLIDFRFLSTPMQFVGDGDSTTGRVAGLTIQRNKLEGDPHKQRSVPITDVPLETLPCQLVLKSIGYRCESISPDIPFDHSTHTIPHIHGRVLLCEEKLKDSSLDKLQIDVAGGGTANVLRGLYVTGWVKRGPSGIIGSNIPDAKETVGAVLTDVRDGALRDFTVDSRDPGLELTSGLSDVVDWSGVLRIDAEEVRRGQSCVPLKERDKILDRQEMLDVALQRNTMKA